VFHPFSNPDSGEPIRANEKSKRYKFLHQSYQSCLYVISGMLYVYLKTITYFLFIIKFIKDQIFCYIYICVLFHLLMLLHL